MRRILVFAVLALAAGACARTPSGPAEGSERGTCRRGGGCDDGLECWSERCVRPPPADCRAVGERLSALSLDNYAPREQREPVIARWATACTSAQLSQREGRCLVEAATEDDLAACPRPLVPELIGDPKGCARLGDHAAALLESASDGRLRPIVNVIDEVPDAVKALCVDGRWAPAAKACLRDAADYRAAQPCLALLDSGDRRALERKLVSLVKRGDRKGPGARPPSSGGGLPETCKDLERVLRAYATCPVLPAAARASMEQALEQMAAGWKAADATARAAMGDACAQGARAMRDTLVQQGCPVPATDPWQ